MFRKSVGLSNKGVMDDPNEEFIFYLEAVQSRLEGNKTVARPLEVAEEPKKALVNTPVEKVTIGNLCSILMSHLYELAKTKTGDSVIAGDLLNVKDFEIYKKKDAHDFNAQFERCLQVLEEEGVLIPSGQADVFGFNRSLLERLDQTLYQRLKNEDEMEFSFDRLYTICNQIVSPNFPGLLSKELVYRIVNDLYRKQRLYKADRNQEVYGVS